MQNALLNSNAPWCRVGGRFDYRRQGKCLELFSFFDKGSKVNEE